MLTFFGAARNGRSADKSETSQPQAWSLMPPHSHLPSPFLPSKISGPNMPSRCGLKCVISPILERHMLARNAAFRLDSPGRSWGSCLRRPRPSASQSRKIVNRAGLGVHEQGIFRESMVCGEAILMHLAVVEQSQSGRATSQDRG